MDRAAHGGRPGGGFISFAPPSVKSMRRRKVEGFQEGGGVPLCRRGWGERRRRSSKAATGRH